MNRIAISRRTFLAATGVAVAATGAVSSSFAAPDGSNRATNESGAAFVHPGLLHSRDDLERMRAAVARQEAPIYEGFRAMAAHPRSSLNYSIRNTGQISSWGRGPSNFMGEAVNDTAAAYQNALMWYITGDVRHADKARDILNAWSSSLGAITGADGQLGSGLQAFKLVNAAEILRYSDYDGWAEEDIARCEKSFATVWYPSISGYALFANGNWDTAALQSVMAIGVFCDDRVMFENAVRYAVEGAGNGRITHIVVNDAGQGQESGRSQPYAQLAIGLLANAAAVAWNQGVNLWGHANNRILAGYEYIARYNLGDDDVPFEPDLDRTGKYIKTAIASNGRAQYQPIYELAYGHYVSRMGLPAPSTEQVIFRGDGGSRMVEGNNDDHPAWGTLTQARPSPDRRAPEVPPQPPSGLTAVNARGGIAVSWVESVEPESATPASKYTVKRSTVSGGPYETVARDLTVTSYTDRRVRRKGQTYYYIVTASNDAGESASSLEMAITAGLPDGWATRDVGAVRSEGSTTFDGRRFTLEASGADIGGAKDEFRFVHRRLRGNGTIVARIVFPVSSQYAKVGVMMRQSLGDDAPHAAMLIQGLALHAWSGVWVTRTTPGGETTGTGSIPVPPSQQQTITVDAGFPISDLGVLPDSATPLPAPYVEAASDGYRMRRPYWVRLQREDSTLTGSISPDGERWTEVGTTELDLPGTVEVGLAACSCLGVTETYAETTTAVFDNVTVDDWSVEPAPALAGELRAATGTSGVELAWSDLDLAGRYTVKRSATSGGPYETVADYIEPVGFGVDIRYTDATGTPGTTYYYVVSAVNVSGLGPSSEEASAQMPTPPGPTIESSSTAYANVGERFEYLIRATNNATEFSATGLPDGLELDAATGLITGTPTTAGEYSVEVAARNATGAGTGAVELSVGTPPPGPWRYGDIGDYVLDERQLGTYSVVSIRTPGITSYDDETGEFTVRGAGSSLNIINQGMAVHYAYMPVEGDAEIVARLVSSDNAGAAGRVGLVMTKSLSPFDQMAGAILTSTGSGDAGVEQFVRRSRVAAGPATSDGSSGVSGPVWLKLERQGDTFRAASSTDGATWAPIGQADAIPTFGEAQYYAGLVVVSGDPMTLNTTVFDHVSVT
jgi:regulation of enolase protein 1 (concanavalin A-like superfamily)/fibronectin type 3 domain-containing protein